MEIITLNKITMNKKGFTGIEVIVVFMILTILGTIAFISMPQSKEEEYNKKKIECDLTGYEVHNLYGRFACREKNNQIEVMKCIREYTEGIDQKYNNPDTVSNLREDNYSNVVETCNKIFGKNSLNSSEIIILEEIDG